MPNGMENVNITYRSFNTYPEEHILNDLISLYCDIFNDADVIFFKKRLIYK